MQGDDSASMTHSVQRSSGSHDGHSAYVAGLESISEALMQVSEMCRQGWFEIALLQLEDIKSFNNCCCWWAPLRGELHAKFPYLSAERGC